MGFHCIVVIYNTRCEGSLSLNSLFMIKLVNLKILVCDNSTKFNIKDANVRYCNKYGIEYMDMKGNVGISKAYNKALSKIDNDNWVVIFDQDTEIPREYFDELNNSILKYPHVYIHVPVVKSNNTQISPCLISNYNVKKTTLESPGLYRHITAINSGMAIRRDVFYKVGGYNEDIFLDYLDHYFIREYKKHFKEIALFNCTLVQSFSDADHSNISSDLNRFKIYKKDFYQFCKDSITGKMFYIIKLFYRSIKLSIFHRNVVFLKCLIERDR